MVITICYGEKREWEDRYDAIDYFATAAEATDGSERDRYDTILLKLLAGEDVCGDR